jgi:hypothetical protein
VEGVSPAAWGDAVDTFFENLFAMPTGIFTILLALVLLYWLFFMFGLFDLDLLGSADGALEGAAEGALEGAAEAAAEGAAEGALTGGLGGILGALRLRSVPVTVSLSFVVFFAWLTSHLLRGWLDSALPGGLLEVLVFIGAVAVGVFGASLAVRPFARLFVEHRARGSADLVGQIVVITTGRVDERFGQGRCMTADSLLLDVRAPSRLGLKRGDKALIVAWDEEHRTFAIEPADPVLLGLDELERRG